MRQSSGISFEALQLRQHSPKVTPEMADEIRRLRDAGMMQHDIAAHLGINQGRVSEVLSGKRIPRIAPGLFDRS